MHIEESVKLDFKDVLIRPKRSTLTSRSEVDIHREFTFHHSRRTYRGIPVIAANMDSTGTMEMARALGDHTYPVGTLAEFNDCYQPTWGRFRDRTLPTPGNHEYYTPGASGYYAYFGATAAPEQGGYYSVQSGKWQLISLNSTLRGAAFDTQLAWLKNELARRPALCTLAYWHHPRYSSGGHADNVFMAPVWQVLADGGVELALAAHDHHYERFAPQDAHGVRDEARGMRQFVVGTGGAWLTPMRFAPDNSEVRNNVRHGVLRLDLFDDGYTWEFIAVVGESDGAVASYADHGSAPCH